MPTQFLDLTNKLLRRLNEVEIEQSAFASVRGVQALAKDAVNASIEEINNKFAEWPFNATSGTQLLVVGQVTPYAFPTNCKAVDWNSFYIQKDTNLGVNTTHLKHINKDSWADVFKDIDLDNSPNGTAVPAFVFRGQNYGFGVTPAPTKAYTVGFDYWLNFTPLSLYNDTPTVPSNFDETIMQGGLYHFYMFRDNDTQSDRAEKKFKNMLNDMLSIRGNPDEVLRSTMLEQRTVGTGGQPSVSGFSGD